MGNYQQDQNQNKKEGPDATANQGGNNPKQAHDAGTSGANQQGKPGQQVRGLEKPAPTAASGMS